MTTDVMITGAAGNLGSLLARHLLAADTGRDSVRLTLMEHVRSVSADLASRSQVRVVRGDLARPETLSACVRGVDVIVHFAGVLFWARPERFLPTTNTVYFRNLCAAAEAAGVRRIVLISFPHVEGETTPEHPATGRLDGQPASAHARTRLEEERHLLGEIASRGVEAVVLRVGMVYGNGILMVDAARWLARRRMLGVWREPTPIHLIATEDFLDATRAATLKPGLSGIYHVGDEGRQTLQAFLDVATQAWGLRKPWRMPVGLIMAAAWLCEAWSRVFGTVSPLTRDFVRIGMCPYYGDTRRMRAELLPVLEYPTLAEGRRTLEQGGMVYDRS